MGVTAKIGEDSVSVFLTVSTEGPVKAIEVIQILDDVNIFYLIVQNKEGKVFMQKSLSNFFNDPTNVLLDLIKINALSQKDVDELREQFNSSGSKLENVEKSNLEAGVSKKCYAGLKNISEIVGTINNPRLIPHDPAVIYDRPQAKQPANESIEDHVKAILSTLNYTGIAASLTASQSVHGRLSLMASGPSSVAGCPAEMAAETHRPVSR